MKEFSFGERYRLELRWKKASYRLDGVCELEGAYFTGPVLKEAVELNPKDFIMLDFFSQYFSFVDNTYVAKFSWEGVKYTTEGTIELGNARISHESELNKVPKLKDDDFLVINTEDHQEEVHNYNLLYKTFVVNSVSELYKFGG